MMLPIPIMMTVDRRGLAQIRLPGLTSLVFRGPSQAELLDDVALHLMEIIPQQDPHEMWRYALCPDIQLRRVKVQLRPDERVEGPEVWSGWFDVMLIRWPGEDLYVARVPSILGGEIPFAVASVGALTEALEAHLMAWLASHHLSLWALDALQLEGHSHLEILEVEADLPTILPETPLSRRKKKPKKKKGAKAKAKEKTPPKRQLVPPITLKAVGVNLIYRARDGRLTRAYGRDELVRQVMEQLDRPGRGVLLVGPQGCGKSAIVHEVARRLAAQDLPLDQRTDLWAVDGNRIIAGMSVVGAWEARVQAMVHELSARRDILYVDDLPTLVYTGRSATSDTHVASFLEPHLAQGDLRLLGECTPARLEVARREAPGFFARLHIIQVPPMSERDTLGVLVGAVRAAEAESPVTVTPEAVEGVLALTRRFARHRCHPGKAVDLLRRFAGAHHELREAAVDDRGRKILDAQALVAWYGQETGLPDFVLWSGKAPKGREVLSWFQQRIVGQGAASAAAAEVVTLMQQGLNDPERPLATFLFVGPTGVGKTETAKALAEYLFGSADRLIRFDMSEMQSPGSMARLFGDRWQPEGELTRLVSRQPFSVVLFDEIEKAHPQVFDAFLQVFGEGRLTNAAGHTTDFSNTLLIMTSNLGVRAAQSPLGFAARGGDPVGEIAAEAARYREAAEGFFRPELFNRIDQVVPFRTLTRADLGPLVQRTLLQIVNRRGLRRSGVRVTVDPDLVELLVDQGFDPRYGARSLKRALEQRLTVPLAAHLVAQPTHRTTLVELFREGAEIGMEVWALAPRQRDPLPSPHIESWPILEARYAELQATLAEVEAGPWRQALVAERGALLARYNAEGAMGDEAMAALESVSDALRQVDALRAEAAGYNDAWLARYDFQFQAETEGRGGSARLPRNWSPARNRPAVMDMDVPVPVDRRRIFDEARERLTSMEISAAILQWRSDTFEAPEETLLVRVLPATEDPETGEWAAYVGWGLSRAWWAVAAVTGFERRPEGWTSEWRPNNPEAGATAVALRVTGRGLRPILEAELGFHLLLQHSGPNVECLLARVEIVAEAVTDPIAQLTAEDEAWRRWQGRRRDGLRGEALGPHPRPPLHIARRYSEDHQDPETGAPQTDPHELLGILRSRMWAQAHQRRHGQREEGR